MSDTKIEKLQKEQEKQIEKLEKEIDRLFVLWKVTMIANKTIEERVQKLEEENVETSNCLYEVENRLQAQIDNIHPVTYNLTNKNWH